MNTPNVLVVGGISSDLASAPTSPAFGATESKRALFFFSFFERKSAKPKCGGSDGAVMDSFNVCASENGSSLLRFYVLPRVEGAASGGGSRRSMLLAHIMCSFYLTVETVSLLMMLLVCVCVCDAGTMVDWHRVCGQVQLPDCQRTGPAFL